MNEILQIFRELAAKEPDGIVRVTEVVDQIVSETGGSREYLERKVRSVFRTLRLGGKFIPMKKRIPTASGSTLVDAYKEKGR